jgi:solute carrier family 13 (sodium-dependent dicarboxylate transporter), member 2/3/5
MNREAEEHTGDSGAVSRAEERFERWRRKAGAVLAPLAFFVVYWLVGENLTPQGRRLAGVLAAVAVLWMTETLPLPVTAILGACLCVLLGVADARTVLAPFADPIVFLFIGSFMLARAMTIHDLHRRTALAILALPWVSRRPSRVLAAMGLVTAVLSMWVSNTATAAMMMPIALGVIQALHDVRQRKGATHPLDPRSWSFAAGMMLMVAYAASIGGIGTPVGSPPNLIALGALRNLAGIHISFFAWMTLVLPMVAAMAVVLFVLLFWLHPAGLGRRDSADELAGYLRARREALGPWTRGQVNTLIAFAAALTLWIVPGVLPLFLGSDSPLVRLAGERVPEAVAALIAALLLFVLPTNLRRGEFTLTWQEAAKIDWGTILLFGGGLSLGALMFSTGVAEALGRGVTSVTGVDSLWGLTAVAVAMGIFLSETTSNTAAANMLLPAVIAMAQANDVNPIPPALGACLGASYGFMLPVSTPPNAIVYGSGFVPIPKMIRAGVLFDVCGFVVIVIGLRILCPIMGFS